MADKSKKSRNTEDDSNVVRIKASKTTTKKEEVKPVKASSKTKSKAKANKVAGEKKVGYFKGAWIELRQVRWPDRRAAWSLTGAVLAYSVFFVVLILLLDRLFQYLFDFILGK